jgi:chromosome segregation ATPase
MAEPTTNDTLLKAVLDLKDELAKAVRGIDKKFSDMNVEVTTTSSAVRSLRTETQTRHNENRREIGKIRAGVTQSNATADRLETEVKDVAAEMKGVKADVAEMKPVVARASAREKFRAGLLRCLRRWWKRLVGLGVAIAGLFVWWGENAAKLAAVIKRMLGG